MQKWWEVWNWENTSSVVFFFLDRLQSIIASNNSKYFWLLLTSVTDFSTPKVFTTRVQTEAQTVLACYCKCFGWHPNKNWKRWCMQQKRWSSVLEFLLYSLWHIVPPCSLDNRQLSKISGWTMCMCNTYVYMDVILWAGIFNQQHVRMCMHIFSVIFVSPALSICFYLILLHLNLSDFASSSPPLFSSWLAVFF